MRWKRNPTGPGQVIDRRGAGPGLRTIGLGGGGIAVIVILLVTLLGGGDLGDVGEILAPVGEVGPGSAPIDPSVDPDADLVRFLEDVLQDTQSMWVAVFEQADRSYRPTDLVVFSGATQSACGGAQAQSGPHYCPADELVYMDLDFLGELQRRFGAAGDTAQAYILAHEVAHHVQNQLGVIEQVQADGSTQASIALELQADCFAGVWLSTLRTGTSAAILEAGDLEEALNAAAAVGDDAIQSQTTGRVNPESWTHGSSEQRYQWLSEGFTSGAPGNCDTY
ncbi:MAG TPA: neutral zinc metallopeptidase [Acidimicrobiia bacterium]|nr:neutral zinc metallopeptidase [Acidimicrobiia bacterium]